MSKAGPPQLRVPLERLHRRPPEREWSVVVRAEELVEAGEELKVADVRVSESSDVVIDVALDPVSEGVMVTGSVTSTWSGACARCLEAVEQTATADVGEVFETRPREGESYPLDEEFADLAPMVRDAVLLELPIGAVGCPHPDPCPHLPVELQVAEDEGDEPTEDALADPRWAALDQLVFDSDDRDAEAGPDCTG